jgi:hypothetical protein
VLYQLSYVPEVSRFELRSYSETDRGGVSSLSTITCSWWRVYVARVPHEIQVTPPRGEIEGSASGDLRRLADAMALQLRPEG